MQYQIVQNTQPSTLSTAFDVIDKVVKILAVIIGAAWAYLNYLRGRTFKHRLEPEISGKIFQFRDSWLISGIASVKNLGLSEVTIEQHGTAVIIDDLILQTSQGHSLKIETAEIAGGVLKIFEPHGWIEPGEPIEESFLFALPPQTDRVAVRLGLRIVSADIEWNADSIVELPQPPSENQSIGWSWSGGAAQAKGTKNLIVQNAESEEHTRKIESRKGKA